MNWYKNTYFTINIGDIYSFCGHINTIMIVCSPYQFLMTSFFSFNSNFECSRIKKLLDMLSLLVYLYSILVKIFFADYYATKKRTSDLIRIFFLWAIPFFSLKWSYSWRLKLIMFLFFVDIDRRNNFFWLKQLGIIIESFIIVLDETKVVGW